MQLKNSLHILIEAPFAEESDLWKDGVDDLDSLHFRKTTGRFAPSETLS